MPHPASPAIDSIGRRRALRLLASTSVAPLVLTEALALAQAPLTPEAVRCASGIVGGELPRERLRLITTALQRLLDQTDVVRQLEIDETTEPALVFRVHGTD